MTTPSDTTMHPFERAKLGTAPFRFMGCVENVFDNGDGTTKGGGTCDYCGNGIRFEMHIEDANGKAFKVGSDCVNQLARKDNAKRDPVIVAVNDARRKVQRDKRHEREATLIAELTERYEAHYGWLHAYKAEYYGGAQSGADSVDWFLANAGNAGKLKRLKWAANIIAALRVMGTPTDALRRPVAPSVPEGPHPLTQSEKYAVCDFARDMMYSKYGHSKRGGWVDEGIRRYVAFGLETYGMTTATETEIEEIRGLVPWERRSE